MDFPRRVRSILRDNSLLKSVKIADPRSNEMTATSHRERIPGSVLTATIVTRSSSFPRAEVPNYHSS